MHEPSALSGDLTSHSFGLSRGKWPRGQEMSQGAVRPRLDLSLTTPGLQRYPNSPNPLPHPEISLARVHSATPWSPVAGPGSGGLKEGEPGHPPRSMAASQAAAGGPPLPHTAASTAQAPRHNGRSQEGGTIGRASVPGHSLSSGSARFSSRLPPLRAHARSSPTNPRRPGRQTHSASHRP